MVLFNLLLVSQMAYFYPKWVRTNNAPYILGWLILSFSFLGVRPYMNMDRFELWARELLVAALVTGGARPRERKYKSWMPSLKNPFICRLFCHLFPI